MNRRISAILNKECKAANWKVRKTLTAAENLQELLDPLATKIKAMKGRKLSVKDHLAARKIVGGVLAELGQTTASLLILAEKCKKKQAKKISAALKNKSREELLANLMRLAAGQERVRYKSPEYGAAWADVEADYMLKLSLTAAEISRRE